MCSVAAPASWHRSAARSTETRTVDPWVPKVDDPATRGGKYVSMVGDDGVRYYFAHLDIRCRDGRANAVEAGDPLGVMGQTGNARNSACHTHFGISWPCPTPSGRCVAVRSGRGGTSTPGATGEQTSPVDEIADGRGSESRCVQPGRVGAQRRRRLTPPRRGSRRTTARREPGSRPARAARSRTRRSCRSRPSAGCRTRRWSRTAP